MNDKPIEKTDSEAVAGRVQRLVMSDFVLINGDCRKHMEEMKGVQCVITDPPYPNNAGHFDESIEAANDFIQSFKCDHWFIFWDEMTEPPCNLPLVAKHIWHRSNTNRPDNYEPIYEYHADGKKRASRVLSYPVVYLGMTGCKEATGHPTQKPVKLMKKLIQLSKAETVADPFTGSGSTAEACVNMGIGFVGAEVEEKHFKDACKRSENENAQGDLFIT